MNGFDDVPTHKGELCDGLKMVLIVAEAVPSWIFYESPRANSELGQIIECSKYSVRTYWIQKK